MVFSQFTIKRFIEDALIKKEIQMSQCIIFYDIMEKNGKTIKENNLQKHHTIPIGTLVELNTGIRLFVVSHARDCDGTPLYELCWNKEDTIKQKEGFRNHDWIGGFDEKELKIIKEKE